MTLHDKYSSMPHPGPGTGPRKHSSGGPGFKLEEVATIAAVCLLHRGDKSGPLSIRELLEVTGLSPYYKKGNVLGDALGFHNLKLDRDNCNRVETTTANLKRCYDWVMGHHLATEKVATVLGIAVDADLVVHLDALIEMEPRNPADPDQDDAEPDQDEAEPDQKEAEPDQDEEEPDQDEEEPDQDFELRELLVEFDRDTNLDDSDDSEFRLMDDNLLEEQYEADQVLINAKFDIDQQGCRLQSKALKRQKERDRRKRDLVEPN